MNTNYCLNPKCFEIEELPGPTCPTCNYELTVKGYRGVQPPIKKDDSQIIIKIQDAKPSEENPFFMLKIIRNDLCSINTDYTDFKRFKEKLESVTNIAKVINIFKVEFSSDFSNEVLFRDSYVGIIIESLEDHQIISNEDPKLKIRKGYRQELISLLKLLDSIHEKGIVHGEIDENSLVLHDDSWKIFNLHPRKNTDDSKLQDLKNLITIYRDLLTIDNPYRESRNTKIRRVMDDIFNHKILTATQAIRALENRYLYNCLKFVKLSWDLFEWLMKKINEINKTTRNLLYLGTVFVITCCIIIQLFQGKIPPVKEIFPNFNGLGKPPIENQINPPVKNVTRNVLSEVEFNNYLRKIKSYINKDDLILADTETRKLMLKIFSSQDEVESKSNIVNDKIIIDFESEEGISNGGKVLKRSSYPSTIGEIQKRRVKEVDRVWFNGTDKKHGFVVQQRTYKLISSNQNCSKFKFSVNEKNTRETIHIDTTFGKLGWGQAMCKNQIPIPIQISEQTSGSESWDVKRMKIQKIFKENGGFSDGDNIPSGYYPITAGLFAHVDFPQFSEWCGYTEKDLKEEN